MNMDGNSGTGIGYPASTRPDWDKHGYDFLPTDGPAPDPNLGGYGHEYFSHTRVTHRVPGMNMYLAQPSSPVSTVEYAPIA
jgi:hypothetical protein